MPVHCRARPGARILGGMKDNTSRFEIVLSAERRRELDQLAKANETSASDLARFAIIDLLNRKSILLGTQEAA